MALAVQSSFSGGELDPALHERTTFDKYQSGLKTGRNWLVGPTGRLVTPGGRIQLVQAKTDDRECRGYAPPNEEYWIEWGHLYYRVYDYLGELLADHAHSWTEEDLPNIRFVSGRDVIFVLLGGEIVKVLNKESLGVARDTDDYFRYSIVTMRPGGASLNPDGAPSGYAVEYMATFVLDNGEETMAYPFSDDTVAGGLPIDTLEANLLEWSCVAEETVTGRSAVEMRVYRRPETGSAFGYIGSTSVYTDAVGIRTFKFTDVGQAADYSNTPPDLITKNIEPGDYLPGAGCIYQQRLLLGLDDDDEAIIASRVGYLQNFTRDFPYSAASALKFKASSTDHSKILAMLENDGLVVFTTAGIFLHTGILGPANMSLVKKGEWVIDPYVNPLGVPGGVIFIDLATSTVRQLAWSTEAESYTGDPLSNYSNHLFQGKSVTSWGFQKGDLPVLWVGLDDGKFLSFTWEPKQQMLAWMRHDISGVNVEQIIPTWKSNKTLFLVEKDGKRYFEMSVPRYVSGATLEEDPEAYIGHSCANMDSMLSFRTLINDSLDPADFFTVTPVDADDWSGQLTISCGLTNIFSGFSVNDIIRYFNNDEDNLGAITNLRIDSIAANGRSVVVTPDSEFPSAQAEEPRLFETGNTFSVPHLAGQDVGVIVDGGVVGSPNNDEEEYPTCRVSAGGVLTLPDDGPDTRYGAIVHIGRVRTCDIETLDIDTVEQRPVHIESQIVNKVYVRTLNSKGLYVRQKFPAGDSVEGMTSLNEIVVDEEEAPIDVNRPQPATSRRHEVMIDSDWGSNGRVCVRQVDPVHAEILSIVPDTEDMRR